MTNSTFIIPDFQGNPGTDFFGVNQETVKSGDPFTPTPSLLEIPYAVAMFRKGHFYFGLAFFYVFFSRIKYFQQGLLRISLRLSWWSSFVCRS